MKKGDFVICVCKVFNSFTYGKKYQLISDYTGTSLIDILNDYNERTYPCYYRNSEKEKYFLTIKEWRENQINTII